MHGLGRAFPFLVNDVLQADDRHAADEWRRLHRMPDALPLPPEPARTSVRARIRTFVATWPLIGPRIAAEP